MLRLPILGVVGGGTALPGSETYELAVAVGRAAASRGALVLCGGRGGVMEGAARGAREAGGRSLGILPTLEGEGGANPFIDCAVFTGLGDARNYVNVRTSDAVIALAGEAGTLSEIALALKITCRSFTCVPGSFSTPSRPSPRIGPPHPTRLWRQPCGVPASGRESRSTGRSATPISRSRPRGGGWWRSSWRGSNRRRQASIKRRLNQATKRRASSVSWRKTCAWRAMPKGIPGLSCQASQVWSRLLG